MGWIYVIFYILTWGITFGIMLYWVSTVKNYITKGDLWYYGTISILWPIVIIVSFMNFIIKIISKQMESTDVIWEKKLE